MTIAPQPRFVPQVFRFTAEGNISRIALVFRRGRKLYHAVVATSDAITLETFPTLLGFTPMQYGRVDYPPRKAASFWLNHDHRPITKRARAVLRGLVARKPREVP